MSGADKSSGYEVGYCKPPKASRFKPGVSGNPKGRPRKAPGSTSWEGLGVSEHLLAALSLDVAGNSRGQAVSLPYLEALMHQLKAASLNGKDRIALALLKISLAREKQEAQARASVLANALEAQIWLDRKRDAWVASGREEIDMDVHPLDIEIDWIAGEVKFFVALTREQRDVRAELVKLRDEALASLVVTLALAADDGDDDLLRLMREVARQEIEHINRFLPSRFRRAAPGENDVDRAKVALEPISAATRVAAKQWSKRIASIFKRLVSK